MSNVQRDVLNAIVSGQNAKISGKEIAAFVFGARTKRGEENSAAMVKLAIDELVCQRVLEKYMYADIFSLTDIGLILVGKSPVTEAARDHLSRHGYKQIPISLSAATVQKVLPEKSNVTNSRSHVDVASNTRREPLQTTLEKNTATANHEHSAQGINLNGVSTPPYADALHFTKLERAIAGMLYDNLCKGGASLSVKVLMTALEEKEKPVTRALSSLSKRGFISFAPHSSSEKSVAYMQTSQAADLGWEKAGKGDTPYLSVFGFSMTSQIILRYMCLRREKEKKSNTSLMQAQRLLEDACVISGSQKECEQLTKNAMDILEQQGLISYITSNMVYYVTLPALVLLGVKAPSVAVVQKIMSHESLCKLWSILQAHPGFVSVKTTLSSDLFPGAPNTAVNESRVVDVATSPANAGEKLPEKLPVQKCENGLKEGLMSEQSAEQVVMTNHDIALEKLNMLAKRVDAAPKIMAVDVKVQILRVIARSFTYDQPDVTNLIEDVCSDLRNTIVPVPTDDVLASRVAWASRYKAVANQEEKVSLLSRLSDAFVIDQPEIASALSDVSQDLKLL